jgi:uncharacterized membrane protein
MPFSTVASESILTPPSKWMPPSMVSSKKNYSYRILLYLLTLLPFTTAILENYSYIWGLFYLLLYPTKNVLSPPSTASFSQKNVINQSTTLKKFNPLHVAF